MESLRQYGGAELLKVAMPVGGVGTGSFSIGGRGDLRDWEIMNRPAKGYVPMVHGVPPFGAVAWRGSEQGARVLEGPIDPVLYDGARGSRVPTQGLPRFASATFSSTYPLAAVSLEDPRVPLGVELGVENPLVPGNLEASSVPMAKIRYGMENRSEEALEVSVVLTLANFIGMDGSRTQRPWHGDPEVVGHKGNVNHETEGLGWKGLSLCSEGVDLQDEAWGTMALATPDHLGHISRRTHWTRGDWGRPLLEFCLNRSISM